jgi:hypothetical protein
VLEPFPERLARIAAGLSALATLVWLLWPAVGWQFEPESAIAFSTALIGWAYFEARSLFRQSAHPHDVRFIRELRKAIPLEAVRYLQHHDFGATYDNERLDGFWRIDFEAHTSGYGPHNRSLAIKFENFRKKLNELTILLAANGSPIGSNARLTSIVPDRDRVTDHFSKATCKLVQQVNEKADEVVRLHEALMKEARKSVPEAFSDA